MSIVVPSYNHAPWVLGAVQSALDQTATDLEILVIDDGSNDDSVARLEVIDDPRVIVSRQENVGLSRTLNLGLERARGRWFKFLPSDDMLAPRCIELELAAAEAAEGIVAVFCLPEVVDAGGRPHPDPTPQAWFDTDAADDRALLRGLVERNFLCAPGALFDRELALRLGGFDGAMRVAQDYDLWLRLLPQGRATLIRERLVRVRWHGENQSAVATPATEAERELALTRALDALGEERWIELFSFPGRRGAAHGRAALARALARSGLGAARSRAVRLAVEARGLDPTLDLGDDLRPIVADGSAVASPASSSVGPDGSAVADHTGGADRPDPAAEVGADSRRPPTASLLRRLSAAARAGVRSLIAAASAGRAETRRAAPLERRRVAPVGTGPRRESWLVIASESMVTPALRGREIARALARRGVGVSFAALGGETGPGAGVTRVPGSATEPDAKDAARNVPWDLARLRSGFVGRDVRLRVLLTVPHPEAIALARDARASGARVLYDRSERWEQRRDLRWWQEETEIALLEGADDLIAAGRSVVKLPPASRRLVHLLPSPDADPGVPRDAEGTDPGWDAVAESLIRIAERPTVVVLLVATGIAAEGATRDTVEALAAARGDAAYRVVVVDAGAPGVSDDLEPREARGEITLLRSARRDVVAGRELGLRATASELVAFVAPGSRRFEPGWLTEAAGILASHADVGAVALVLDPSRTASRRGAAVLSGDAVVVPRAVLGAVAACDAIFETHAAADADLGFRIRAAGYRVVEFPESRGPVAPAPTSGANPGEVGAGLWSAADDRLLRSRWPDLRAGPASEDERREV